MQQSKINKLTQGWQVAIKICIALLAFWFIYREVFLKRNISDLILQYDEVWQSSGKIFLLIVIFLLMLLNWSLEAMKWKLMMSKLEHISFLKSLEAVFSGITISFFTPNRIGEYAGRIFHLRKADKIKATLVTILENLSQLLVTLIVGSVSMMIYIHQYVHMHGYLQIGISALLLVFIASLLVIFFYAPAFSSLAAKNKLLKRFASHIEVSGLYSFREMTVVLVLALCRFFVFTFQFYLLLNVFGVSAPLFQSLVLVNMIFFVMTLIPTFALSEIGVRGAVATYFLKEVSPDSVAILNATVSLWFINLVIPAVAGIIFVFQFRFVSKAS